MESGGGMVLGVGIDMVEISRVERAAERFGERFLRRTFTPGEREHCARKNRAWESFAARFAVKEAAFKALGAGWAECGGFLSVEVVSDAEGRPGVVFHGAASRIARTRGVAGAHVSITHDSGFAAAVVILESDRLPRERSRMRPAEPDSRTRIARRNGGGSMRFDKATPPDTHGNQA
jgi:holo-[acyl-carrier protein] synthase